MRNDAGKSLDKQCYHNPLVPGVSGSFFWHPIGILHDSVRSLHPAERLESFFGSGFRRWVNVTVNWFSEKLSEGLQKAEEHEDDESHLVVKPKDKIVYRRFLSIEKRCK